MTSGGPGDHPLSDVIHYGLEVYGEEADKLLRRLGTLLSRRELEEFWNEEIGFNCKSNIAHRVLLEKVGWAEERARKSGWETDDR